jgi:nitrogenase molybdenum-iron protein alpha chain
MIGLDDTPVEAKVKINILGEYNIGGDAWEIDRIFALCGIEIVGTLSGGVSYDEICNCHMADLNVVMCHRSINYMAEMMEEKFGIPWFKVNFIGIEGTKKSLRKIAAYYGDKELIDRVEEVIAAEMAESVRFSRTSRPVPRARPPPSLSEAAAPTTTRTSSMTWACK